MKNIIYLITITSILFSFERKLNLQIIDENNIPISNSNIYCNKGLTGSWYFYHWNVRSIFPPILTAKTLVLSASPWGAIEQFLLN